MNEKKKGVGIGVRLEVIGWCGFVLGILVAIVSMSGNDSSAVSASIGAVISGILFIGIGTAIGLLSDIEYNSRKATEAPRSSAASV